MFKKTYYGAHIAPACAYCLHGSTAADPKMILCKRKGVVSPYYCCRKFSYDPLMRIPRHDGVYPAAHLGCVGHAGTDFQRKL